MRRREAAKEQYDKNKREKLKEDIKLREEKIKKCKTQKEELLKERNDKRLDILDLQYELLRRGHKRENMNEMKRITANEKTVVNQMALEKNLSDFHKRMNLLKDQSVYKKTSEERFKIYKDLKKAEAERKKKELEEKLDKLLNKQ